MKLTKKSLFTNIIHTMELLNVTPHEYAIWCEMLESERPLIQNFFKKATADEREFILTGCTPEEWELLVNDC